MKRMWWSAVLLSMAVVMPDVGWASQLPRTHIRYEISVKVDPQGRTFRGKQKVLWTNRSKKVLDRIPMHLYLNAFSNRGTTWMRESFLRGMDFDEFLEQYQDPWGYIELESVYQSMGIERPAGITWKAIAPDDGNPHDRTLVELELARVVPAGGSLELEIQFKGRLPTPIARTGCTPAFCLVAQWFPKIGVLERPGVRHAKEARWAARQFHGPTEFYADFADFDVTIDAPDGFLIGATGRSVKPKGEPAAGFARARYKQRAVHDFAFVLGNDLVEYKSQYVPKGAATTVDIRYLLPSNASHHVDGSRRAVHGALEVLGARVGPYPYGTLTVVYPPFRARRTAGMEYPTLITSGAGDPMWNRVPFRDLRLNEYTDVHEFGHQYFYGLLASNEQEEAFLDEGFNSYWDTEIQETVYGKGASLGQIFSRDVDMRQMRRLRIAGNAKNVNEPLIKRPSALFDADSHGTQIYARPAVTFQTAANLFGSDVVDRVFAAYYRRFHFKHPDFQDFMGVARRVGGRDFEKFIMEAFTKPEIPDYRVDELTSAELDIPLGRFVTESGAVVITDDNKDDYRDLFVDARARDQDGKVWAQLTDPGWARDGRRVDGTVTWVGIEPASALSEPADDATYFETTIHLTGPAWDHLPVDVLFTFEDGVQVRDRWDGRATWRGYRFVRAARLVDVRVDPDDLLLLDVRPKNNSRAVEKDAAMVTDWGTWLASVAQWIAGGLSLWL